MRKKTKANSENCNTKIQRAAAERIDLSSAATKAMFDQMAAICMTMGMTYGVYMPVMPYWYENLHGNF